MRQVLGQLYPATAYTTGVRARNGCFGWQNELSDYDRHGPGLVGSVGEFVQEKSTHGFDVMSESGNHEVDGITSRAWTQFLLNIRNDQQSHYATGDHAPRRPAR